jgi:spore coat protein CotH
MLNPRPPLAAFLMVLIGGACGGGKSMTGTGGQSGAGPADTCPALIDDQGRVVAWACGPTSDELFDNGKVAEVHLTFDPKDLEAAVTDLRRKGHEEVLDTWLDIVWAKWQHCGPYTNHVPVTMEYKSPDGIGNAVLRNAGIRLRGTKSRYSNPVAGFKVDFQALMPPPPDGEEGRKFGGETKLSILSVEGDQTVMIQCLAYKVMREFGDVPAPRCNHLKFFVNGAYYGLMQSVEEVDDSRFRRHFFKSAEDNGTLYSCSGGCGYDDSKADLEYYGDQFVEGKNPNMLGPGEYPKAYEAISLEGGEPEVDGGAPDLTALAVARKAETERNLIPMLKCGDKDTTPDDAAFRACIEEWIDVDEWLKVVAAESLMPTIESFVGAKRNYYLYFRPDPMAPHGGRFLVYSWDYDAAMNRAGCNPSSCDPFTSVASWYTGGGRPPLVIRLTNVFKERYCATMTSFLRDVYLPEHVDSVSAALAPVMTSMDIPFADRRTTDTAELVPRPPLTYETWSMAVSGLRSYMVMHRSAAQNQVNLVCAGVSAGDGGAPVPDGGAPSSDADSSTDASSTSTDGGTP